MPKSECLNKYCPLGQRSFAADKSADVEVWELQHHRASVAGGGQRHACKTFRRWGGEGDRILLATSIYGRGRFEDLGLYEEKQLVVQLWGS